MIRPFSFTLGLGAGVALGVYGTRRYDAAQAAVAPTSLAERAGRSTGSFAERLRYAAAEGRRVGSSAPGSSVPASPAVRRIGAR